MALLQIKTPPNNKRSLSDNQIMLREAPELMFRPLTNKISIKPSDHSGSSSEWFQVSRPALMVKSFFFLSIQVRVLNRMAPEAAEPNEEESQADAVPIAGMEKNVNSLRTSGQSG